MLETLKMKILLKVPIINDKIKAAVREHMIQAFGGNFYEIIIGGASVQSGCRKTAEKVWDFPLYRRIRYDRVRTDHLL